MSYLNTYEFKNFQEKLKNKYPKVQIKHHRSRLESLSSEGFLNILFCI